MKKLISNDYLTILCRLIFGGIFIYASLAKLANPDQFARIVYNFHILPGSLVNLAAIIMPVSEFLAGTFLIFGFLYKGSRNYLLILLSIFMIAILVNVFRGVNIECGCFTVSSKAKTSGIELFLRDFAYLIPGLILLFSQSTRLMIDHALGWVGVNPRSSA